MSSLDAAIDKIETIELMSKQIKTTKPVKINFSDLVPLPALYTAVSTFGAAYGVKLLNELITTYK